MKNLSNYEKQRDLAEAELYNRIMSDPFFVTEFRTIYMRDGKHDAGFHLSEVASYRDIDNREKIDYMEMADLLYYDTNN